MASFPFRYTLQNAGGRMNHEMESLAKSHPFSCFFFFNKSRWLVAMERPTRTTRRLWKALETGEQRLVEANECLQCSQR